MSLSAKDLLLLAAISEHGEISTSLANPPVMTLARAGLVRFRYRSEDLNIIAITDAGRAVLAAPAQPKGKG